MRKSSSDISSVRVAISTKRLRIHFKRCSSISGMTRSEEHTSELQSHSDLVCRLLLEKKKKNRYMIGILYGRLECHGRVMEVPATGFMIRVVRQVVAPGGWPSPVCDASKLIDVVATT